MSQPFADAVRAYFEAFVVTEIMVENGVQPDEPRASKAVAVCEIRRRELVAMAEGVKALPLIEQDPTNVAGMRPHQDDTVEALAIVTQVSGIVCAENSWIVNRIAEALDRARRAGWAAAKAAS